MEHQRRQREVVDAIDLPRDGDLLFVVAVDFHEHIDSQGVRLGGQFRNEVESFRDHETARSRLFDCIADGIEPDHPDPRCLELPKDGVEVCGGVRMPDIDIHLLRIEGGPQHLPLAREQRRGRERQCRARPVNGQDFRFGGPLRKDPVVREKHPRIGGRRTILREIKELRRGG